MGHVLDCTRTYVHMGVDQLIRFRRENPSINIHSFTCTVYRLLTDFRFSAGPTDERYVTGGGGGSFGPV